jgi:hypothetical protein
MNCRQARSGLSVTLWDRVPADDGSHSAGVRTTKKDDVLRSVICDRSSAAPATLTTSRSSTSLVKLSASCRRVSSSTATLRVKNMAIERTTILALPRDKRLPHDDVGVAVEDRSHRCVPRTISGTRRCISQRSHPACCTPNAIEVAPAPNHQRANAPTRQRANAPTRQGLPASPMR